MFVKKFISILTLSLIFIGNLLAQDFIAAKDFVVLQKSNPKLVVIDASKDNLYQQSHIEGAINVPYATLNEKEGKIDGLMLAPEQVAEILGKKGVAETDAIVVYDEGTQKYATRVYWILKYLGANDVKILHNENAAFRAARVKLTSTVPSVKAKKFTVNLNPDVYATTEMMESAIGHPEYVIIDVRTPEEFNGTGKDKNAYSKGHIKSAVNIPYESIVQKDTNIFISPEAFKALAKDVEFTPEKTYLVYCKTGVKGATLFAYLKNVLGLPNVKNYEGAYAEWDYSGKISVK